MNRTNGEDHSNLVRREEAVIELMKGLTLVGVVVFILGGLVLFTLWSRDQSKRMGPPDD